MKSASHRSLFNGVLQSGSSHGRLYGLLGYLAMEQSVDQVAEAELQMIGLDKTFVVTGLELDHQLSKGNNLSCFYVPLLRAQWIWRTSP